MDLVNSFLRSAITGYVSLFGDAHPLVSLVPLSVAVGLLMLWVFKISSNQKGIERAKKKMQAYLLELRLYGDGRAAPKIAAALRDLMGCKTLAAAG